MTRTASGLAAACLLAATAPSAGAQEVPSPYRFVDTNQAAGLFAGRFAPGRGTLDLGPGPGSIFGARYGIRLSSPISFEGWASFLPTTRDVIDPTRPAGERAVAEADISLLLLEAVVKFSLVGSRTWHGIGPYVLAGGGLGFELGDTQTEDLALEEPFRFNFGSTFVPHAGGGLRWLPSDLLELRADARLTLWKIDTPEAFLDPELGLEGIDDSEWVGGASLTLGAALRF